VSPARLRVYWTDRALEDLDREATAKQSERVIVELDRMAGWGWSTGRRAPEYGHNAQYRSIRPLGVIYEVVGRNLYVLRVLHGRRLRELP